MTSAKKPRTPCVECSKPTDRLHPILEVPLCRECQNSVSKYDTICKTDAIRKYKLKPKDLDTLDHYYKYNRHGGPTYQYLLSQVQALAEKPPEVFAGRDWAACAHKVRKAATDDFRELLRIGNLDPARHLRFADWSGISFRDCDLRGCDFTGARLHNCDFADALIDGARFDQAEIRGANLKAARDWKAHVRHWTRPQKAALNVDRSLPLFEPFQDAPFSPQMVVVPAGEFIMGSPEDEAGRDTREGPQHKVVIGYPFAVGRYPVTLDEWYAAQADKNWQRITGVAPCKPDSQPRKRGDHPVIDINWQNAHAYTKWLREKTGKAYRLPSEAEWEYVCRAGTTTRYSFGHDERKLSEYAWYNENSNNMTQAIGEKKPNAWGLYDVHGNVYEWVADIYHTSYSGIPTNGSAWSLGGRKGTHVVRGGSWNDDHRELRSAARYHYETHVKDSRIGFRVARLLE